jgi:hypothetical protein
MKKYENTQVIRLISVSGTEDVDEEWNVENEDDEKTGL